MCFMLSSNSHNSLELLRRSLPELPGRLKEAGNYIVDHEFDAATRSMREIAQVAGLQPATFTRLAQAIGYSGWDDFRASLIEIQRGERFGPFSARANRSARAGSGIGQYPHFIGNMMDADSAAIARIAPDAILRAAQVLAKAPRIWVAGFRSCRSVAALFHYQMRLFRPDDLRLVGGTGPEDCDFGAFKPSDAIVAIGFEPYSRASVLTSQSARAAGCTLVVIADRASAPIAEGADHVLIFEAADTPAFFPSLTGAIAIAQALVAVAFELGGKECSVRLRQTEARLSELSQYVPDPST